MKSIQASSFPVVVAGIVALMVAGFSDSSMADKDAWKAEMIADALLAAPPSVTDDAKVFGWSSDGELTLVRYGTGPYVCVASGGFSVRVGKPPLPYPDPMCLDQNAWAYLQALWSGPNPGATEKRLPSAPGLVWMLGGMNISKDAVDIGAEEIAVSQGMADQDSGEVIQMTPHVMIMPLPFDEQAADLTSSYRLDDPLGVWIMAAGKPHEHLMVHFSARDTAALVNVDK